MGLMPRPAACLPPPNGYRGDVARKSRNRGGAPSARTAGRPARVRAGQASPAQASPAQASPAQGGTVQAGPVQGGKLQAGPVQAGTVQAGTVQLTAPVVSDADRASSKKTAGYPGQDLGLPERGPGSVASMPRRLLALLIDWLLSMIIAYWLTHSQFWTIAVFAIETYLLTALGGSTVGKRLVGIRTVRIGGGPVGFGWALVRTAILLTVVPPLLTDRDLRGLHDRASDTIVVRI
jgi:hypothetical protein